MKLSLRDELAWASTSRMVNLGVATHTAAMIRLAPIAPASIGRQTACRNATLRRERR